MGWLELLPLLRRILPLLDRLAPMLEGIVAGRFGARAEAERAGASIAASAEIARVNDVLAQSFAEHRAQIAALAEEIKRLRLSNEVFAARLEISESQLAKLGGWVKISAFVTPILLVLVFLFVLISIHRSV